MMKSNLCRIGLICLAVTILFPGKPQESEAATICSPGELDTCISAIATSTASPGICCPKLKEQRQCFCKHLMDPNLGRVINSPAARRVAASCGVLLPDCYLL